jgi:hypothetical protein
MADTNNTPSHGKEQHPEFSGKSLPTGGDLEGAEHHHAGAEDDEVSVENDNTDEPAKNDPNNEVINVDDLDDSHAGNDVGEEDVVSQDDPLSPATKHTKNDEERISSPQVGVNQIAAKAVVNGLKTEGRKLSIQDRKEMAFAFLELEVKDEGLRSKTVAKMTELLEEFAEKLADPDARKVISFSELPAVRRVKRKCIQAHNAWVMGDVTYCTKLPELSEILAVRYVNGGKLPETIGGYLVSMGEVTLLAVQRGYPIVSTTTVREAEVRGMFESIHQTVDDMLRQQEIQSVQKLRNEFEKYKEDQTIWKRETTRSLNTRQEELGKLEKWADEMARSFAKVRQTVDEVKANHDALSSRVDNMNNLSSRVDNMGNRQTEVRRELVEHIGAVDAALVKLERRVKAVEQQTDKPSHPATKQKAKVVTPAAQVAQDNDDFEEIPAPPRRPDMQGKAGTSKQAPLQQKRMLNPEPAKVGMTAGKASAILAGVAAEQKGGKKRTGEEGQGTAKKARKTDKSGNDDGEVDFARGFSFK